MSISIPMTLVDFPCIDSRDVKEEKEEENTNEKGILDLGRQSSKCEVIRHTTKRMAFKGNPPTKINYKRFIRREKKKRECVTAYPTQVISQKYHATDAVYLEIPRDVKIRSNLEDVFPFFL
ncbi:hypothetical protein TWF225_009534 [Orbilia oligospora]|nr:hypothetical protein TWF225_009534 [Orbilia oligospora]KAF3258740.1 hypothetical protein TWF128_004544 [Orbilia oligospora]KAF3281024.1 hypothetical protein TWF132_011433 [Orbilia oligospora]